MAVGVLLPHSKRKAEPAMAALVAVETGVPAWKLIPIGTRAAPADGWHDAELGNAERI